MKKPKVFENKFNKKVNNNQEMYETSNNIILENDFLINDQESKNQNSNLTIIEKINMLLNRNGYIFNVLVTIKTKDKNYTTRIAGKVDNRLITLDNDIIDIDDITDILIKD